MIVFETWHVVLIVVGVAVGEALGRIGADRWSRARKAKRDGPTLTISVPLKEFSFTSDTAGAALRAEGGGTRGELRGEPYMDGSSGRIVLQSTPPAP